MNEFLQFYDIYSCSVLMLCQILHTRVKILAQKFPLYRIFKPLSHSVLTGLFNGFGQNGNFDFLLDLSFGFLPSHRNTTSLFEQKIGKCTLSEKFTSIFETVNTIFTELSS